MGHNYKGIRDRQLYNSYNYLIAECKDFKKNRSQSSKRHSHCSIKTVTTSSRLQ